MNTKPATQSRKQMNGKPNKPANGTPAVAKRKQVSLDELFIERVSEQLLEQFKDIEVIDHNGLSIHASVSDGKINALVRISVSIKKAIAFITTFIGLLVAAAHYLAPHLQAILAGVGQSP